jgi:hypothetical protein
VSEHEDAARRGPTLYATLLEEATIPGQMAIDTFAQTAVDNLQETIAEFLRPLLTDAYIAGVHDGFAHGVAAEADRTNRTQR